MNSGLREPVRRARDERLEGVVRERQAGGTVPGALRDRLVFRRVRRFALRHNLFGGCRIKLDRDGEPDGLGRGVLDQPDVVLGEPVAHVLGGGDDLQDPVVQARGANASEPHRERALGQLLVGAFDDVRPGAFSGFLERCDRHSYPQRLSTVVETLGGRDGVAWGGSTPPGNDAGL
jgi:hypothetical protein